jgi:response regulator RpfG family c-di-GMP phosphodiesterase
MKEHVIIGYEIVKSIQIKYPRARFLNMALDITRHHHEKYDGTGYPDGLKGDEIPLAARIVGLADFYDALTSKRVYKRKYTHEEAKSLILNKKGIHFDPILVDMFMKYELSFKKISDEHGEL